MDKAKADREMAALEGDITKIMAILNGLQRFHTALTGQQFVSACGVPTVDVGRFYPMLKAEIEG